MHLVRFPIVDYSYLSVGCAMLLIGGITLTKVYCTTKSSFAYQILAFTIIYGVVGFLTFWQQTEYIRAWNTEHTSWLARPSMIASLILDGLYYSCTVQSAIFARKYLHSCLALGASLSSTYNDEK